METKRHTAPDLTDVIFLGRHYGMFTEKGNAEVGRTMKRLLSRPVPLSDERSWWGKPTDEFVHEVQRVVVQKLKADGMEVGDTAVRESIWYFLEDHFLSDPNDLEPRLVPDHETWIRRMEWAYADAEREIRRAEHQIERLTKRRQRLLGLLP